MIKYLLDTHVILWILDGKGQFSDTTFRIITDPGNVKYVSIASAWEVAIKIGKGNLQLEGGVSGFLRTVNRHGIKLLPIKRKHIKTLETLPLLHRDPFDRILVASAMAEGMSLITADENIPRYDVASLW